MQFLSHGQEYYQIGRKKATLGKVRSLLNATKGSIVEDNRYGPFKISETYS
jgi:hypothetical protein